MPRLEVPDTATPLIVELRRDEGPSEAASLMLTYAGMAERDLRSQVCFARRARSAATASTMMIPMMISCT
jgi:hypothetical protein